MRYCLQLVVPYRVPNLTEPAVCIEEALTGLVYPTPLLIVSPGKMILFGGQPCEGAKQEKNKPEGEGVINNTVGCRRGGARTSLRPVARVGRGRFVLRIYFE